MTVVATPNIGEVKPDEAGLLHRLCSGQASGACECASADPVRPPGILHIPVASADSASGVITHQTA